MKFDKVTGQQTVRVTEDKFELINDAVNKPLKQSNQDTLNQSEVATLAISVGYKNNRRLDSSPPTKPFKIDSLDQDQILKTLIERRHTNSDQEELREILAQYLEGGTQTLYESIENGYIGYKEIFDTDPGPPFTEGL